MKKYVALLSGILMFSNTCLGENILCSGGTVITAKNGTKLCRSNQPMTWYASHAWCAANNGKLAAYDTICNKTSLCDNIKGTGDNTYKWGFVNKRNKAKVYRVNLTTTQGNPSETYPINRPVRSAPTGETTSNYGAITDMFALCEPLNSTDEYSAPSNEE